MAKNHYFILKKRQVFFSNSFKSLIILSGYKPEYNYKKIEEQLKFSDKSVGLNEDTIFKNIYQLKAGTYSIIDLSFGRYAKKINIKPYWNLKKSFSKTSFKNTKNELVRIFRRSI